MFRTLATLTRSHVTKSNFGGLGLLLGFVTKCPLLYQDSEAGIRRWITRWDMEHAAGRITRPLRHKGIPYAGIYTVVLWSSDGAAQGFSARPAIGRERGADSAPNGGPDSGMVDRHHASARR